MSDILLVHGSCHGAWCWRDTIPALENLGHTARAMDMPSHGDDPTPLSEVTLESCAQSVADALGDETTIVAHSWGGFPATLAADIAPHKVKRLIYLCAYIPQEGLSLVDMRKRAPRQPILKAVARDASGCSYGINPDYAQEVFYADCPTGTSEFALAHISQQAILPQITAAHLGEGHKTIPKSYIRCLCDNAIPTEFQAEMVADWPSKDVYEMATSHSPFFADPKGLAAKIDAILKNG